MSLSLAESDDPYPPPACVCMYVCVCACVRVKSPHDHEAAPLMHSAPALLGEHMLKSIFETPYQHNQLNSYICKCTLCTSCAYTVQTVCTMYMHMYNCMHDVHAQCTCTCTSRISLSTDLCVDSPEKKGARDMAPDDLLCWLIEGGGGEVMGGEGGRVWTPASTFFCEVFFCILFCMQSIHNTCSLQGQTKQQSLDSSCLHVHV